MIRRLISGRSICVKNKLHFEILSDEQKAPSEDISDLEMTNDFGMTKDLEMTNDN